MAWIRRHLRIVALTWLVGQAAAVSAVSLGDCCANHRTPAVKAPSCHGSDGAQPGTATACPMRSAGGRACPMHREQATHADHEDKAQNDRGHDKDPGAGCSLRSTCAGPIAALTHVLSVQGVLPEPVSVPARLDTSERVATLADASLTVVIRPESPPPRAQAVA